MITIGFISDIHFGELARSKEFTLPNQQPKGVTQNEASITKGLIQIFRKMGVQYLFVGGDLTSRARPQEFYYCEEKIKEIAEESNIPLDHVIIGVGNHDIDWNITKISEQYKNDDADLYKIAQEGYRLIASNVATAHMQKIPRKMTSGPVPFSGVVDTEDITIFVLNSGLFCTHDQPFSHGKLSAQQLNWFTSTAEQYVKNNKWKIVLLHHHPHNYAYNTIGIDTSTLEEGSEFMDAVEKAGIDLILHGHRHHPRAETVQKTGWNKAITFVCGGSLSVNAEHRNNGDIPNTFHVMQLMDEEGVLQLYNFEYSASEGWKPIRSNCPETPIDADMKLGKLIDKAQAKAIIEKIADESNDQTELHWDDYGDTLHYYGIEKVNALINEILSPKYTLYGKFPEPIYLIKKEVKNNES